MSDTFNLDRTISIQNNVDALGKNWVIHNHRGTSLCHIRPNPDRSDAKIPEEMQGQWTKPSLLREKLVAYLNSSWDMADAAIAKAASVKQAEVEAPKKEEKTMMDKLLSK